MLLSSNAIASTGDYRVGTGDVLSIHVYNEDDLSRDARVDSSCDMNVGLIGSVAVCGLTTTEVEAVLRERLADGFLVSPQVTVGVAEYHSQKVEITGEVQTVGRHWLEGPTSLLDVINSAGGPSADNVVDVIVVSANNEVRRFDLQELATDEPVYLADGDIIRLLPGRMVYVQGEVKTEGAVTYKEGLTLTQALATAGGPGEFANLRRVTLIRAGGEKLHVNVSKVNHGREADVVLMPDDRLIIRRSAF